MIKVDFLLFGAIIWGIYSYYVFARLKRNNRIALLGSMTLHILFNGARWQLFPAYFLSVTLILLNKNSGKTVKYLISTAFCFSFVLPNIVPIISFPDPEGPHETGSLIHHWVDEDREEWFTPENNNDKRQFMVQIWYPGINQEKSEEKLQHKIGVP